MNKVVNEPSGEVKALVRGLRAQGRAGRGWESLSIMKNARIGLLGVPFVMFVVIWESSVWTGESVRYTRKSKTTDFTIAVHRDPIYLGEWSSDHVWTQKVFL